MEKLILECKGCGYTWYPEKAKWEMYPDAMEPDCPNEECKYYGKGFHSPEVLSIWQVKGTIKPEVPV